MNLRSFRIAFSIVLTPRNVRKLSVLKIFLFSYYFPSLSRVSPWCPETTKCKKAICIKNVFFVFYSQFPQLNFLSSLSRLSLASRNPAL